MDQELRCKFWSFQGTSYCEVQVPSVHMTLTCRMTGKTEALCVAWQRWDKEAPSSPPTMARREAETAAVKAASKLEEVQ